MTREEVTAMAREAGAKERFVPHPDGMSITGEEFTLNQLERFAALVAAREREALSVITPEVIEAGCEVLYGHPREKAIEWAKEDKFDGKAGLAEDVFTAQIKAAIRSRSTD